jgi:hypothetical protein
MGLFGDKANAHSTRQDALAAHVFGWKMGNYAEQFTAEIFTRRTMGCCDIDQYHRWLTRSTPISFSTEQKDRMRDDRELSAAGFLMRLTRQNRLRDLREFGTYQDSNCRFSDAAVHQVIELAGAISKMVETSRDRIAPAPIKLFDPNWP